MPLLPAKTSKILIIVAIALVCLLGIALRLYHITENEFLFFDEGFYLNQDRDFIKLIESHYPTTLEDVWNLFYTVVCLSLREGKALWFFIMNLRVFWGGLEQWFFPRVVSAVAGVLTFYVIYIFARRFFNSRMAGWLSVVILAILPSHVFYSRLGLQEVTCTLFFLLGIYFYMFPAVFGIRTFLSSFFLVLAYFSNYRLIIIPLFVLFCEMYMSLAGHRKPDFRKYMWNTLIFFFLVFLIGNINHGQNTIITFAWMFYQAQLGGQQAFDIFNLLSYPYYIFRLEGILFGFLFFGNIYYILRREWNRLFPFAFALLAMGIFSFTADKAMRYICIMLPFMVMAVSGLTEYLLKNTPVRKLQIGFSVFVATLIVSLGVQAVHTANFKSDYQTSIEFLKTLDSDPKVVTTQVWVQNLYMNPKNIVQCPLDYRPFAKLLKEGYRYLVICPQLYVSFETEKGHFSAEMDNYLQFIAAQVAPIKTFPHFNSKMLERFVFEHTADLKRAIAFLKLNQGDLGALRVYDLKTCINMIDYLLAMKNGTPKK